MAVVARRIRATPERGAADAWQVIVDLIAPTDGAARRELIGIEGIASSIISTESPKDAAMVVRGNGPRVRMYCLYDDDAIAGDDANESALAECPTEGDWSMSLPADAEDVSWVRDALAKKSKRVTVREKNETVKDDEEPSKKSAATEAAINMEAFLRP
ncbi:hypothetical protein [Schlesneria paludicola]|uniref:hypothetical protein n=1 Tax=Schlesneria paludicola TaxID=360056 RepID=UPI000299E8D9|nr:hypothetical protein [Schlesneria paludicola]